MFLFILIFAGPLADRIHVVEPKDEVNYRAFHPTTNFDFRVDFEVLPPTQNSQNKMTLRIKELQYEPGHRLDFDEKIDSLKMCIQSISLWQTAAVGELRKPGNIDNHRFWYDTRDGFLCGNFPKDKIEFDKVDFNKNFEHKSLNSTNSFFYPFDNLIYQFYVEIYYIILPTKSAINETYEGHHVAFSDEVCRYSFSCNSELWNFKAEPLNAIGNGEPYWDFMNIVFQRPISSKIYPIILFSIVLLLINATTILKSKVELFSVGFALFLGIFKIKQISVPSFIQVITFWDILALCALIFLIYRLKNKYEELNISEGETNSIEETTIQKEYIINIKSNMIHNSNCSVATKLEEENKKVIINPSVEDVSKFILCKKCIKKKS